MICLTKHRPNESKCHSSLLFAPQISTVPFIQVLQETYPITYNHFKLHSAPHDPTKLRIIMNIQRQNFIICISGILHIIEHDRLIFENGNIVYFDELCSNVYNCYTKRALTSTDVKHIKNINIHI